MNRILKRSKDWETHLLVRFLSPCTNPPHTLILLSKSTYGHNNLMKLQKVQNHIVYLLYMFISDCCFWLSCTWMIFQCCMNMLNSLSFRTVNAVDKTGGDYLQLISRSKPRSCEMFQGQITVLSKECKEFSSTLRHYRRTMVTLLLSQDQILVRIMGRLLQKNRRLSPNPNNV